MGVGQRTNSIDRRGGLRSRVTAQLAEHVVQAAHTTGVRPEEPTRRGVVSMQASRDGTGCQLSLSDVQDSLRCSGSAAMTPGQLDQRHRVAGRLGQYLLPALAAWRARLLVE